MTDELTFSVGELPAGTAVQTPTSLGRQVLIIAILCLEEMATTTL